MKPRPVTAALVLPVLLSACVTSTTTTRTWGGEPGSAPWARTGHVEQIQETVHQTAGNPGGGAMAGAVIGGVLGSMLGGTGRHGYYRPSAAGAVFGAATGAVVGAATSQGGSEERFYDVIVRFDDGGYETFRYGAWPPFRVGDPVQQTEYGLAPM